MAEKIVRKIDELGRIVLPREFTSALLWTTETKIAITRDGDGLILQADKNSCFLCGSEDDIRPIKNRHVCSKCINEMKEGS